MRLKFISILLCISLAFSFSGCGNKEDGTENEHTEEQTEEKKEDIEDKKDKTEKSTESAEAGVDNENDGKDKDSDEKPLFFISKHSDWNYDGDTLQGDHQYSYLHFSDDFGDSHPDLLKQIKKINDEIKNAEKERLENEKETIADWNASHEYDMSPYHDEWNLYVTRNDEIFFSVMSESMQESSVGDFNSYTFKGHTYYTDSGKEIKLSDMLKDEDGFYDELTEGIEAHLKESLGDDYLKGEELNKRLRDMIDDGSASFVLNPQGVQIWIDSYNLSPECMSIFYYFGDKEDKACFKDEFTGSVPDEWIMMPMKGSTQCYDAEDDGSIDTINVTDQYDLRESGESEEYYITGLSVGAGDDWKEYPAKTGEATDPYDVYLVHKDNKTFLMAFHYEYVYAYINTWSVNGKKIKEADELLGHFSYVPTDEQEGTETYVPYYVPNDLSSMDICLISKDDPEDETEVTMALNADGTFSEKGKKSGFSGASKKSTEESTDDNGGEDARIEAYEDILSLYKKAQDGKYTEDQVLDLGLKTELIQRGWPLAQSDDAVKYKYYDVDGDGADELIITYCDSLIDVYGFDGSKTVAAYSCPYRGEATLHTDGRLEEMFFPTMSYGSVTWYEFDPEVADFLPTMQEKYEHDENGKDSYTYYRLPYGTDLKDNLIKTYKQSGRPDWIWDKEEEITEKRYGSLSSDQPEVSLIDATLLKDFNY